MVRLFACHRDVRVVVLLLIVWCAAECVFAQRSKLNQSCKLDNTGVRGTCTLSENCPEIAEDAERGITPTICGAYSNRVPIVCCPSNLPRPNENTLVDFNFPDEAEAPAPSVSFALGTTRIAAQKCKEYLPTRQIGVLGLSFANRPTQVNITKCNKNGVQLIVNGTPVNTGEFPFMAAIGWDTGNSISFNCGGSLISSQHVMTAAHCTFLRQYGEPTLVRLGATDLTADRNAQSFRIVEIKTHPDYVGSEHYNDIALLKLHREIKVFNNFIRPICLWDRPDYASKFAVGTGWGRTEEAGDTSTALLKVSLSILTQQICQQRYVNIRKLPRGVADSMVCSGNLEGGSDTCQGDSGGPLFMSKENGSCEYYQIGITSFGLGCARPKTPGLYTRVYSYLDWIERNVW